MTQLIQRTIELSPRDLEIIELSQCQSGGDHPVERFITDGIRLMLAEWAEFEEECSVCWKLFEQWNYQPYTYPDSAIVYVSGFSIGAECLLLHPFSSRNREFEYDPHRWIKTYSLQEIREQLSPYDRVEDRCEEWLDSARAALGVA